MIKTEICELLGIQYPIIQGGMAWISDWSLCSAVSEAGGLGVIAAGNAPKDWVVDQIRKVKEATDKPFAVNVMLLSPFVEEIAQAVCEEGVKVVITGAGNPGKYVEMWKKAGITIIPVVPSVALAKRMERIGVDALVAEGGEAGGHVGEINTMALMPQVVDAVSIPVIAAGGIADGRGALAAFMLGASALQIGTRFLVAKECNVHENYKMRILDSKDTDTEVTGRSTGHPVRVLKNKLTRKFKTLEKENVDPAVLEELGAGALYKAAIEGDMEQGSIMAGQVAGLIKKEQTAKEIIQIGRAHV
jgi:enoyl-[acyl-carrier protein] reductase II